MTEMSSVVLGHVRNNSLESATGFFYFLGFFSLRAFLYRLFLTQEKKKEKKNNLSNHFLLVPNTSLKGDGL